MTTHACHVTEISREMKYREIRLMVVHVAKEHHLNRWQIYILDKKQSSQVIILLIQTRHNLKRNTFQIENE